MTKIKRSDNPYRDVGLPDAELLLVKQEAVQFLLEQLHQTGMTQSQLAEHAGMEPPHISEMLAGKLNRFGIERINRALAVFGARIESQFTPNRAA